MGDRVGGVHVGVGVRSRVPRIWRHGGSCGGREWPWGVIGVSVGVGVGELASEWRGKEERGLTWAGVTTRVVGSE